MHTRRNSVDDLTADRLLAGGVTPDDAPPGFAGVAGLLASARADFATADPAETAVVRAMAVAVQSSPDPTTPRRKPVLTKILSAKAAAIAGVLALTATGAAAATGSLPTAAQDGISRAVDHVGVNLPRSEDHPTHDASADQGDDNGGGDTTDTTVVHPDNHGGDVSSVAHSDDTTGRDHGAAVSGVASDGKSQAGDDHGKSGDDHGQSGQGATVSGDKSDGHSEAGEEHPATSTTVESHSDDHGGQSGHGGGGDD